MSVVCGRIAERALLRRALAWRAGDREASLVTIENPILHISEQQRLLPVYRKIR